MLAEEGDDVLHKHRSRPPASKLKVGGDDYSTRVPKQGTICTKSVLRLIWSGAHDFPLANEQISSPCDEGINAGAVHPIAV